MNDVIIISDTKVRKLALLIKTDIWSCWLSLTHKFWVVETDTISFIILSFEVEKVSINYITQCHFIDNWDACVSLSLLSLSAYSTEESEKTDIELLYF